MALASLAWSIRGREGGWDMGDDQVVARELEQAEARLVESREEAWDASRRLLVAAIEVGRLRALAEVAPLVAAASNALRLIPQGDYSNGVTDPTGSIDEGEVRAWGIYTELSAALERVAVREEVQE